MWILQFPFETCLGLGVALLVDRFWGEPPTKFHPVVWMGHYLGWIGQFIAPVGGPQTMPKRLRPFAMGALAWTSGAAMVCGLAWGVQLLLSDLPLVWGTVISGLVLKPLLAWRMLHQEVAAVDAALRESLNAGRERLSWLCSRDVSALSETQVRETAIETLAENLNDSVLAPMVWFLIGGLPAAALYRFANTADAMWGYRGLRQGRDWTWAGKWAARADDVLSWWPARITGLALMMGQPWRSWRPWWTQSSLTPSPNGGWPMGAMALALDVQLGKPGVYTLNAQGDAPTSAHVAQALQRAGNVVAGTAAGVCLLGIVAAFWKYTP
jgi:adenosylcobinamide-phosphate synthase